MVKKVQLHVDDLASMGKRFVDARHPAQEGEDFDEVHVPFLSLQAMTETLSPRRLKLLRLVRQHGAASVLELAASLSRDYKSVHQDVSALEAGGLLLREARRLTAPWDEVQASINLESA